MPSLLYRTLETPSTQSLAFTKLVSLHHERRPLGTWSTSISPSKSFRSSGILHRVESALNCIPVTSNVKAPPSLTMNLLLRQPMLAGSLKRAFPTSVRWPILRTPLYRNFKQSEARVWPLCFSPRWLLISFNQHYSQGTFLHSPSRPYVLPHRRPIANQISRRSIFFSTDGLEFESSLWITRFIQGFCTLAFGFVGWARYRADRMGDPSFYTMYQKNAVCSSQNYREGRWWTLLISSLMHESLTHLLVNMYALNSFGPLVLQIYGLSGFAGLWIIAQLGCAGASIYWEEINRQAGWLARRWDVAAKHEQRTFLGIKPTAETRATQDHRAGSVGASGALSGMLTLTAVMIPSTSVQFFLIPIPFPIWLGAGGFSAFSYWAMATGSLPRIDHAGHLGGMMGGLGFFSLRWLVGKFWGF